ncbi:helix-turn-helix transcriptional regulator [Neptuniibacter marinus]|uniref:helix-turn-helix transcriptional regulator n=1 Tax=Neptuniibacter marinus TaxID=1806670 RepID=UPI003B5A23EA
MTHKLIKLKDVLAITGLSRSHIYALAQQERFPKPVKLTERSSAWVESEVQEWIDTRIAQRDIGASV